MDTTFALVGIVATTALVLLGAALLLPPGAKQIREFAHGLAEGIRQSKDQGGGGPPSTSPAGTVGEGRPPRSGDRR